MDKCLHLGSKFDGVISSDDFSVYNGYPVNPLHKCLILQRRHFKKVVHLNHRNNSKRGQAFLDLIDEAFVEHHQWGSTRDEVAYQVRAEEFNFRLEQSLQRWTAQAGYQYGKLLRSLREKAQQGWYFLQHPEVPPANNLAKPEAEVVPCVSLRLAVTKPKVLGVSHLMNQFAQTAPLLSVVQTYRRHRGLVQEFFQEAFRGNAGGEKPLPFLLPQLCT
jgi:transposase